MRELKLAGASESQHQGQTGPSRRSFLGAAAAATVAAFASPGKLLATPESPLLPVCIFSKHLQWLAFDEMAEAAARLGFDGVDLTVRPGGHVEPEQVERDLPVAVRAIRKAGLKTLIMTTAVVGPEDSVSRQVLATASELGISHYRLGYHYYSDSESIQETLERVRRQLAGLAELNEKLQIRGGIQNHAGLNYFGASIWDMRETLQGLNPRWIGCQFDLRHATVESSLNWPVDFRSVREYVHSIVFKDFIREGGKDPAEAINCPLGEGVTDFKSFLPLLRASSFDGPATLHCEFPLGGAEHGGRELTVPAADVLAALRKDLEVARGWLTNV